MNSTQHAPETHPDETRLAGYVESPDSNEFRDVGRHLAACPACRKTVTAVQSAVDGIRQFPPSQIEAPSGEHPDELTVADYVDKRLSTDRHAEMAGHLTDCVFCTKAVLHYATHSAEMRRAALPVVEVAPQPIPELVWETRSAGEKKWSPFGWRMPVWIGVPATAVATAILVLVGIQARDRGSVIVSFQDTPGVVFSPTEGVPPGMEFFGSAREQTKPFGGLTVRREDDRHLAVKWAEIEGARDYSLRLFARDPGNAFFIGQANVTGTTEVRMAISRDLQAGRRYEWELSGHTQSNGLFVARGSFVLAEQ